VCEGVFAALGIDWEADGSGDGTSPASPEHSFFRPIAR
jgi:hypothetical protein